MHTGAARSCWGRRCVQIMCRLYGHAKEGEVTACSSFVRRRVGRRRTARRSAACATQRSTAPTRVGAVEAVAARSGRKGVLQPERLYQSIGAMHDGAPLGGPCASNTVESVRLTRESSNRVPHHLTRPAAVPSGPVLLATRLRTLHLWSLTAAAMWTCAGGWGFAPLMTVSSPVRLHLIGRLWSSRCDLGERLRCCAACRRG